MLVHTALEMAAFGVDLQLYARALRSNGATTFTQGTNFAHSPQSHASCLADPAVLPAAPRRPLRSPTRTSFDC